MADTVNVTGGQAFYNLFDIGVREQVQLALCNSSSDTFFLLSGPPAFKDSQLNGTEASEGTTLSYMCPLLFTMSFTDSESKQPDQQIGSFGTANTVTAPTAFTPSYRSIAVGAASYVTASPCADTAGRNGGSGTLISSPAVGGSVEGSLNRWNLLKRVYYWMLANKNIMDETGLADFQSLYIGDESLNPNAVAPDTNAIWGNFAKSDLYKIPFGLMVVVCDKSKHGQVIRYYEGCVLQNAGNSNLDAGLGRVTTYQGTQGFSCTYAKVRTFSEGEINSMIPNSFGSSGSQASFLEKVLRAFGQTGNGGTAASGGA